MSSLKEMLDSSEIQDQRQPNIVLPNNWDPRWYQLKLWCYLQNGGKRAVEVAHRRWGKDDVALHWTAVAANDVGYEGCLGRVGNYWHMLPEASQARKAIWDAINPHTGKKRIDEAFPEELRKNTRNTDMLIEFKSGSTWQVVGSDNYNSLVGSAPVGIVFSEWALADPASWIYLSPILVENKGWAVFIYTSRGRNHGYSMYRAAQLDKSWHCERLTVEDTRQIGKDDLKGALTNYQAIYGDEAGQAFYEQEYLCSFDAAILGSYYGSLMNKLELKGRFTKVDYDPSYPVHTAWDLGFTDDTCIWFYQVIFGEVRLIDFYMNHGQDIAFYCNVLKGKEFFKPLYDKDGEIVVKDGIPVLTKELNYGFHYVPWDAQPKTMASKGKSVLEQAWEEKIKLRLVKNVGRQIGIQAVRQVLPRCWFDAERCAYGIEALRQYKREWDEEHRIFKDEPDHDWTSHPADGFRYLAWVWSNPPPEPETKKPTHDFIGDPVTGRIKSRQTINEIIEGLARKRREREGK